jgi:WhiB family transcriptional regulator, redox-sensing transcriptional regulator
VNELQRTFQAVQKAKSWMKDANCRNMDTNMFFPEKGDNLSDFAREVCDSCIVQKECFWYANETYSTEGLLGGMTPRNRQRWRSKNKVELGMSEKEWLASKNRDLMYRPIGAY